MGSVDSVRNKMEEWLRIESDLYVVTTQKTRLGQIPNPEKQETTV